MPEDSRYDAAVEIRDALIELDRTLDRIVQQLQSIIANLKEMNERQRFQS